VVEKVVVKNNPNKCLYCGACVGVCPTQALTLKDTKIVVDEKKCISCGACVKICPVAAMSIEKKN
jgi:ferredoxin